MQEEHRNCEIAIDDRFQQQWYLIHDYNSMEMRHGVDRQQVETLCNAPVYSLVCPKTRCAQYSAHTSGRLYSSLCYYPFKAAYALRNRVIYLTADLTYPTGV